MKSHMLAGRIALSGLIAVGGIATFAPIVASADEATSAVEEPAAQGATRAQAPANRVEGTFSYCQNSITSTTDIVSVFSKAAQAVCASLPVYETGNAIAIDVGGTPVFTVSPSDIAEHDTNQNRIIGCACSSNGPGGGAIINADVSGVTLESLMAIASASGCA